MAADPSGFDYYRRGEPLVIEKGTTSPTGFDYFRRGEPLEGFTITDAVVSGRGYKRLVGPTQLAASATTLYTVPTGRRAKIKNIHLSNPTGASKDVTLSIGSDAGGTRILDGYPVAADSFRSLRKTFFMLDAGDTIQGFCSAAASVVAIIDGYLYEA